MKTVQLALRNWVDSGSTLYSWLGAFWTKISADRELVRRLQEGYGLEAT